MNLTTGGWEFDFLWMSLTSGSWVWLPVIDFDFQWLCLTGKNEKQWKSNNTFNDNFFMSF